MATQHPYRDPELNANPPSAHFWYASDCYVNLAEIVEFWWIPIGEYKHIKQFQCRFRNSPEITTFHEVAGSMVVAALKAYRKHNT